MRTNFGNNSVIIYPIDGADVSSAPTNPIEATSMKHAYVKGTNFGFAIGATPTTREEIVHVCNGAGTITGFHCLCNDTGSAASVTFNLKKNGTTVLSGVVTVANTDADMTMKNGTISLPTVAANDILSIALTVTTSTGMQGPYAWVNVIENASPV